MDLAGDIRRPDIVREMILASLKAGQEDEGRVDLKLMNASLKEMRFTAKAFAPYRGLRKVSVFGSARTRPFSNGWTLSTMPWRGSGTSTSATTACAMSAISW